MESLLEGFAVIFMLIIVLVLIIVAAVIIIFILIIVLIIVAVIICKINDDKARESNTQLYFCTEKKIDCYKKVYLSL